MEFGRQEQEVTENEISVYELSKQEYSPEFKNLARDFYLKL
jgi:hypothetical protein